MIPLSDKEFGLFSKFIFNETGISLPENKKYLVQTRLFNRLQQYNFKRYIDYYRFIQINPKEKVKMINQITTNETYFFREKDQFEVLANRILPELDKMMPKNKPLRILSSPCSTGEEPYSMILHIVEEGEIVEKRDIEVVGIDIDSTVIEKAKKGKYTDRSVHAIPKNILSKWFNKKSLGYELCDDLQGTVDFKVANVFDKTQMRKLGKFDVIFSRNMLIYFDDASRKEVAMTYYELLKPRGYVFLGHAESMSRIVSVFKTKKVGDSIVYQKG